MKICAGGTFLRKDKAKKIKERVLKLVWLLSFVIMIAPLMNHQTQCLRHSRNVDHSYDAWAENVHNKNYKFYAWLTFLGIQEIILWAINPTNKTLQHIMIPLRYLFDKYWTRCIVQWEIMLQQSNNVARSASLLSGKGYL